ncbi:hypothetical protein CLOBOL_00943 [Enterocloster bolteae ATCC BAA-613]|uniref:Uncharacterized protein n=1 Tax=Enterocloster bolteae (strain ATCC BAA-613 / DSM 15670 / CCUG 46953 / JCM 12243 / WAL 16351) TaxID=411902 RepID=A8RJK8_ENTBW|nr:hypothetical protein CLOBOL_00943 [Enterocloster bolteae ATCC BAA-613]
MNVFDPISVLAGGGVQSKKMNYKFKTINFTKLNITVILIL